MSRKWVPMKLMEQSHQIFLDHIPKDLIKLCRKIIWAWCWVMVHLEDGILHFHLCEILNKDLIFLFWNLRMSPVLDSSIDTKDVPYGPKKVFIILSDIFFEFIIASYNTLVQSSCSNMKILVFLCFPLATKWKLVFASPSKRLFNFCPLIPFDFFFSHKVVKLSFK